MIISNLEKIQDKNLRKTSEWKHMQDLHHKIWQWPIFKDTTTDTTTSQPPKFLDKPRPLEVTRWQDQCKKDICGSQKLQGPKKPSTNSPNSKGPKGRRGKKRKVPKGQYACQFCPKNHQIGQKCPKRRKRDPKKQKGGAPAKDSKT